MKKIIKLYACLLAVLGLTAGCSDYLKEDSGDLLIPEKVEEYAPMLYKEDIWTWIRQIKAMPTAIRILLIFCMGHKGRIPINGRKK